MKSADSIFILVVIISIILLLVIGPFIQIWAINTLFDTSIEYSWINWFAALMLTSSLKSFSYNYKN